jgi:predicted extracellular nuclease
MLPPRLLRPSALLLCAAATLATAACGQDAATATGATSSSSGGASTSSGGDGGSGPVGDALGIANWNLHNLFDNKADGGEEVVSTSEYQEHLAGAGKVLAELDPDIAVFAEVENQRCLEDLSEGHLGNAYTATLIDGNDGRSLDVGVLSKLPFDEVVSHKDDEFTLAGTPAPTYKFTRDCLELHLTYGGRKIVLLAVHYRSKGQPDANPPIPDDPDKRLAEAQRTRAIADGLMAEDPERAVLVLGDFNDLPGSFPVQAIEGKDPNKFVDAAESIPSADRYTYTYQGTLELIDHQMMSPLMAEMLDPASVSVLHSNDVDDVSDHSPLMATYLVR